LQTHVAHLPFNGHSLGRLVPRGIERGLGAVFGWHLQIRAVK
jgi:hypothetical protein